VDQPAEPRHQRELGRDEALRLLGSVSFGRVVFTMRALPAVRPVNHLLEAGAVVIRTHHGAALAPSAGEAAVVAYEADDIDPVQHVGWSVIIVGRTELVTDEAAVARYRERLRPWVAGSMDVVVRIRCEIVTGFALAPP
jgi:hypothetical protein